MVRAVVHIGMEKTGTTSIQAFLRKNRTALIERGFLVPESLGALPPRTLVMLGIEPGTLVGDHRLAGLSSPDEVSSYLDDRMNEFTREIANTEPECVVLTNERLSVSLNSRERIERFRSWVEAIFDDATIVVYLRRQDEMLLAMYSTLVKVGHTNKFSVPVQRQGGWDRYDYRAMLSLWASVFGENRLIVRVFEFPQLEAGDVVQDFCRQVGIEHAGLSMPAEKNKSLTGEAIEFLRAFNQHVPYEASGPPVSGRPQWSPGISELRKGLLPALEEATARGEPLVWQGSVRRSDFLARYADGNSEIASEYLGRADGRLFLSEPTEGLGDGGPRDEVGSSLETQDAVAIAAALWTYQRRRILALEDSVLRLQRNQVAKRPRSIASSGGGECFDKSCVGLRPSSRKADSPNGLGGCMHVSAVRVMPFGRG